jgi:hypothetical protein
MSLIEMWSNEVVACYSAPYTYRKMTLKIMFCHFVWVFMCQRVGISCILNTIMVKLSLIHEDCEEEHPSLLIAIHNIAHGVWDLAVRDVYFVHVIQIKAFSVQDSPYLC